MTADIPPNKQIHPADGMLLFVYAPIVHAFPDTFINEKQVAVIHS